MNDQSSQGEQEAHEAILELIKSNNSSIRAGDLGYLFRAHKGQVFGNRIFKTVKEDETGKSKKSKRWTVLPIGVEGGMEASEACSPLSPQSSCTSSSHTVDDVGIDCFPDSKHAPDASMPPTDTKNMGTFVQS